MIPGVLTLLFVCYLLKFGETLAVCSLSDSLIAVFGFSNLVEGFFYRNLLIQPGNVGKNQSSNNPPFRFTTYALMAVAIVHTALLVQNYRSLTQLPGYVTSLHHNNEMLFNLTAAASFSTGKMELQFSTITALIGLAAVTYSGFYMDGEPEYVKFVTLLNFFLLSIFIFFKANNLVTLVLGWELMGIFSYFLIAFWKMKLNAVNSGTKAATYNYFSDAALIVFSILYYQNYGHLNLPHDEISFAVDIGQSAYSGHLVMYSCLIVAISCKSVIGFMHFWLPDSMEAPVPASALIHSATLVSAGVFLTLKFKCALVLDSILLNTLTVASIVSVVIGSLGSITFFDLKKILAYSTISNCGMMMIFALYLDPEICFLFFALHGVYKAYAFFIVGFFFKKNQHKQDYRYFGDLLEYSQAQVPIIIFVVLSLGGFPLSFMYFVKHSATEAVFGITSIYMALSVQMALTLGTLCSLTYALKIVNAILFGKKNFRMQNNDIYEIGYSYSVILLFFVLYQLLLLHLIYANYNLFVVPNNLNITILLAKQYEYVLVEAISWTASVLIILTNAVYGTPAAPSIYAYAYPVAVFLLVFSGLAMVSLV